VSTVSLSPKHANTKPKRPVYNRFEELKATCLGMLEIPLLVQKGLHDTGAISNGMGVGGGVGFQAFQAFSLAHV
jgi:hypothetical protein